MRSVDYIVNANIRNLNAFAHTLRLCWPPDECFNLTQNPQNSQNFSFSNNAGLESTEFASRFALAGHPDEDNQRLYENDDDNEDSSRSLRPLREIIIRDACSSLSLERAGVRLPINPYGRGRGYIPFRVRRRERSRNGWR